MIEDYDYLQDHGEGREAGGSGEQGGQAAHRLPAVPGQVIHQDYRETKVSVSYFRKPW